MMEFTELKNVCNINMGQSPESSSYNENGVGLPFFQGNADFGDKHPITRVWCTAPTKIAHADDILISVRAPIGALNYAKEDCCIGRGLAAITPDKTKFSNEFIFWLLKGKNAELNSKGTGSTFKAIGRKVLEEIKVPDITFEQQNACAIHLEKVYSIIQNRKHELAILDNLIKARFVEMFGTGDYHSVALKDITEVITKGTTPTTVGFDFVDNGVNFFKIESIMEDHTINLNKVAHVTEECNRAFKRSQLRAGDILFSIAGAIGRTAIITERDLPGNTNQALAIIRLLSDAGLSRRFLISSFESPLVTEQFNRKKRGIAQINLSLQDIGNLIIPVPNKNAQDEFERFGHQVEKSKFAVQKALEKAQLLLDSLMQQYFG